MAGRFVLRRSETAREQAQRDVAASTEKIARLVELVTSLADRMDAMPSAGPDRDRDRRARVQILRRTAEAATRSLDAHGDCRSDRQDGQHQPGA